MPRTYRMGVGHRFAAWLSAAIAAFACTLGCAKVNRTPPGSPTSVSVLGGAPPAPSVGAPIAGSNPIPVTDADPARGNADALVTVVWFGDLQCPFSARAAGTLSELQAQYSADELRVVWKHLPLPFHSQARRAAEHAAAVFALGGSRAFWAFVATVSKNVSSLDGAPLADWAAQTGVSAQALAAELASGRPAAKVEADQALAAGLGADGTPTFFMNGARLDGAQPLANFVEVVNAQRQRARDALARGTPRPALYAELVRSGLAKPAERAAEDEPRDTTVFRVPVGTSPVRGNSSALVTIVEFSDFQCPFCKRVQAQLEAIRARYGDDVRFVFKQLPLPFHPRAEPAAELSLEARAQRGDSGFYEAHDALFASAGLGPSDLDDIAHALHLDVAKVHKTIDTQRYADKILEDLELAEQVDAQGTPHFFINGRRLVGAQPLSKFTELIDEELTKAKTLVARGVAREAVYDTIENGAREPAPDATADVPAPTARQPALGAPNAKVVVQEFADFECGYCAQADETVHSLLAAYPGKVKVVWRHRPLPFHARAELASEAAIEAYQQKGNAAFWSFHDLLFAGQQQERGLERDALVRYAKKLGLDRKRFESALDDHRHASEVQADAAIADSAGIAGTPTFVINGALLVGAQPLAKFRRVVEQALKK